MQGKKPGKVFISKFKTEEIHAVMREHMRNPSVSGSVTSDARMHDAAGSDYHKLRKLTPMATPFGASWVKSRNAPKYAEEKDK